MSELLPTLQARSIRDGLVDYLTTTFALADDDARDGLDRFLSDPATGMFKGPYVRLRLPFRAAEPGWQDSLEWSGGFEPYGHQAAAFERLSSMVGGQRRRPQPTLVTTGTGSGKTEAFLYPILDHVLRARRDGITGTKALILYPMNALANDQAQRLTRMLSSIPELATVTAALYTGQDGPARTRVSADGLITDRAIIRDDPPDILLTNYKMLDQLLLRDTDQEIWRKSATSLQYLVLDEFHTYDGAQGTDVAMLLRRLGLTLKSHWSESDPDLTESDRSRPLGRITPVATSATLGDKGDPAVMLDFARTVFGEAFDDGSVVTESRLNLDEWTAGADAAITTAGLEPVQLADLDLEAANAALDSLGSDPTAADVAATVLTHLYSGDTAPLLNNHRLLLEATRAHPLIQALARVCTDAVELGDLVRRVVEGTLASSLTAPAARDGWGTFLSRVVAMLGHVRALVGRDALSVDVHLWVRELNRIDRAADAGAQFRWSDDGQPIAVLGAEDVRPSFPAVFCRHCGRSGWMVGLAPVGDSLATDDSTIRREHATGEGRARALLYAPREADSAVLAGNTVEGLAWFSVRGRHLLTTVPDDDDPELREGWILPVLTITGPDADEAAKKDTCPSCGQMDAIRFLGSAIATLLSVALTTVFGSADLDPAEKKALVFTDAVQDAAHRAGFVQARSHTFTLRAVLREAVAAGSLTLDALVDEVIQQAGDDTFARYRVLAPECADRESFTAFWTNPTLRSVPASVRSRVRRRLALDVALEFGLNSRTGRTLELTGAVAAEVDAGHPAKLAGAARTVLQGQPWQDALDGAGEPDDDALVRWVRGVLDRMRAQGAIDHPWFVKYQHDDGHRWPIWGGRPRGEGMPAFPPGRPAPGFPRIGGTGSESGLDAVTSPQSWYARWTSKVLGVSPSDGGRLARFLLERLAHDGTLTTTGTKSGATTYAIPPSAVVILPTTPEDLSDGRHLLTCDVCRDVTPGSATTVDQLVDGPCLLARCGGRLHRATVADGFYRRLYSSPDMRRIVAREHTSLLDDETRVAYENGFKSAAVDPQAPNVLVATPTLEMGIDIGDLSAVFLSSLPRTVASYLQRVGRAGRLTGNALSLAFVTGRGEQLPKLGDPLSVINGEVRPPATYLQAEEILRRQYTAHLVDELARDAGRPHPRKATGAIGSSDAGTFLGDLIVHAEAEAQAHVDRFLGTFDALPDDVTRDLREWVTPVHGPGTSGFAAHLHAASGRWQRTIETLNHRIDAIDALLPELIAKEQSPAATDDDRRALRSAQAARKLTLGQRGHLTSEYWIGVLEEYGILPNYTLLDDTVTLDVGLSWVDPDTNTFESSHAQFQRGSANAIRDFAPGATFYARGWEIAIDAVDLGMDGESIRPWAFCPACGFAADVALEGKEQRYATCPRCGSAGIADTGQLLDVVELTHVTSEVRRDEVMISDHRDDRARTPFQIVTAADVDPKLISSQWFAEGTGIGCTYARSMDVRWINVGPPGHGVTRVMSGEERPGALFRVCAGCGKLDTDSGRNRPHEHRPWCPHRTAADEHTRTVALSRTLRTQGLLIRLPHSVTIGDDFAVPSLAAALLLGLREQVGGHPDHIQVERVIDPTLSDGSDNHDAILMHDVVPGGTGYLAELASPERLRDLLVRAWDVVRECECQHEERLACHRCLLPFTRSASVRRVSRASADRHLRTLLGLAADAESADGSSWTVTEIPPAEDPESHLEQRFRKLFVTRLETLGANVTQVPGAWGNTVRFTLPGGTRQWTLTPQINLAHSKPDFVLESNDTSVPAVAIFTDGRAYHATAAHNRLADDADKRAILRELGHVVLAITSQDVAEAETGNVPVPSWYSHDVIATLMQQQQLMTEPGAYEALQHGPIGWLMRWITTPSAGPTKIVGRAVPMLLATSTLAKPIQVSEAVTLAEAATGALVDQPVDPGSKLVRLWRHGPLAAAIGIRDRVFDVALVLDDRPEILDEAHAQAWREWLQLSNALNLRDWPTVITTTSGAAAVGTTPTSEPLPESPISSGWEEAYSLAMPGEEQDLIRALSIAGAELTPPELGHETPAGIPVPMSWPHHLLAVATTELSDEDRTELQAAGWHLVPPDVDAIRRALTDPSIAEEA
ncbi:DEAD/DEAH box helicase [Occultella aeris]|uniref:Putative ATP-dependent helicase Lhr n=1 Tax=Occultella aeris TaxID=2761496 RepID=A0A7M4DPM5_9MICO|nr:DEAD/DEAH box helicase [Occultella aeris]VZO39419.1 putative ATP-dependent helicase Lhr [Occultella aeris]